MDIDKAYDLWSPGYDTMRNRTRDLDEQATAAMLTGKYVRTILEAGCGTGKNTSKFAAHAKKVVALDFSEGMLQIAREKVREPHVVFCQADITKPWPVPADPVDLISFNLVLEHIEDINPVFSQAASLLAEGGELFISELHPYKQYAGGRANFEISGEKVALGYFVHHISEFWDAAVNNGLSCTLLKEWFLEEEGGKVPRLINFIFQKKTSRHS